MENAGPLDANRLSAREDFHSRILGFAAKLFFDSQQLVVLADAVGSTRGSGLDLPGVECHGEIGNKGVFGFPGSVRHHRGVSRLMSLLYGLDGLGQTTNLIDLDQDGVGYAFLDTAG